MRGILSKFLGGNIVAVTSRYSDIALASFVVGVVAMMILPLPTWLLDILLTLNISVSVILLMMAVYVPDAIRFSAFPTLLLVTTLFRLGLNVSSTRLILSQADAGEVIRAFGQFVTKGNLIVGAVVFLILTLIQFIVIAKGSERVAEVAARFTLDAMPGKQMSIDADLRAGAFDLEEARRRRALLQRESQLYGSMDGAMKFVKGDAIAGIVIILINIVGGLAVGTLQMGMPAADAISVYGVLTIGDGLVSQLPALIISVSAGMIVTRVASEEPNSHLGKDIGTQILRQPKALAITAGLLLVLGLIPGLPFAPFALLGVLVGFVAFAVIQSQRREERERPPVPKLAKTEEAMPALVTPVAVEVTPQLAAHLGDPETGRFASREVPDLRMALYADLGVAVPHIRVRTSGGEGLSYKILLRDVPIAAAQMPPDRVFASERPSRLDLEGVEATAAVHPGTGLHGSWVPSSAQEALREAGIVTLDPCAYMVLHLLAVLKHNAAELVGIQEVQDKLDRLEKSHPALVREVAPRLLSIQLLTDILRRLVEEQVSIRDLKSILESLADWARAEKDPVMLTEHVRSSLRRQLTYRITGGEATLAVYLLDPLVEDAIRGAIVRSPSGSYLAMDPEMSQDILDAIRREVQGFPEDAQRPVILTSMEIRRFVRRLCEIELPGVIVVSFQELSPELQIQPIARISVGGGD